MKNFWEQRSDTGAIHSAHVSGTSVEAATRYENRHAGGGAGNCHLEDFVRRECKEWGCDGECRIRSTIVDLLGESVAAEVDVAVAAVLAGRHLVEARNAVLTARQLIDRIPIAPTLKELLEQSESDSSLKTYCNASCEGDFLANQLTRISGDTLTLEAGVGDQNGPCPTCGDDHGGVRLVSADPPQTRTVEGLRGCSGGVALGDTFILESSDLILVHPDGRVERSNALHGLQLGSDIRLERIYRCGERVLVNYRWVAEVNQGLLLEYTLGVGWTARWEPSES